MTGLSQADAPRTGARQYHIGLERGELAEYILHLARDHGVTILLIEHDMDLVMDICNPVIVMSHGRTLMEGTPRQVRNDPRVIEAYLGA